MRSSALRMVGIVLVVSLLVSPAFGAARPVGVSPGDQLKYTYNIVKFTPSATQNTTTIQTFNETVTVEAMNLTRPLGEVGYNLKIEALHNQSQATTTATFSNFTTVFDPYDNRTYQGILGFPAFVYTDVVSGNTTFTFNYLIKNLPPNASIPSQNFHVNVNRTGQQMTVKFNDLPFPQAYLWNGTMKFDMNSGVLQRFVFRTYLFGTYSVFIYDLLSYSHYAPFDYAPLLYGGVAVIVLLIAYTLYSRPSRAQRRKEKLKEKFGGR